MSNKASIEVPINEYTMRDANPNVPYSPAEIATQALECWREVASIIHYHARDPQTGAPASDPQLYEDTGHRIKDKSDLITMQNYADAGRLVDAVARGSHFPHCRDRQRSHDQARIGPNRYDCEQCRLIRP